MKQEELIKKIADAKTQEELEEIRSEIEKNKEEQEIKKMQEERELIRDNNELEQRNFVKVDIKPDDKAPKETRSLEDILASKEYRSAWAKKAMGRTDFTKAEERALGDAVTTTSTEFVASAANTQGINNGGLLIPTQVRLDMLRIIEETSPFLRDVRKIFVAANVEMPILNAADDAKWYSELTSTDNEGINFGKITLTGHDLAKQIEVTWRMEAMSVESFLDFITKELAHKAGRALATAVIYGDGNGQPTGALKNAKAVTADEVIAAMINGYAALSSDARVGAKSYISSDYAIKVVGFKDANGAYPYLQGLNKTALFDIEVDPFLKAEDMILGNPENYILNTVQELSINKEVKTTQRRTIYSIFGIYDGKPYPNSFVKAKVQVASEASIIPVD